MADQAQVEAQILIDSVNGRVDKCIKKSASFEKALWIILTAMIVVGIFVLIYGVMQESQLLIGISLSDTGLMVWPVLTLIGLHKRRIALMVIPAIAMMLSPSDAAREIHALIEKLLEKT